MEATDALTKLAVALFGAGGLVSLVKAVLAWRAGKEQKEQEIGDRYIAHLDKRVAFLEREREKDARYVTDLIQALARAGLDVPNRRR